MTAAARASRRPSKAINGQLAAKLNQLEGRIATHDNYIVALLQAVRSLMATPEKPKRRIGFARD